MKALLIAGAIVYGAAVLCAFLAYIVFPTTQAAAMGAGVGLAWSLVVALVFVGKRHPYGAGRYRR